MTAVENNRTARWLIRAGIAAMAYDVVVALAFVALGERMPPGWAVPAPLISMVLFAAAYLTASGQVGKKAGIWANFAMIFWMLRNIPHWAKLAWVAALTAVPVSLANLPASKQLNNPAALNLTVFGLYFALSSTLIAWAKLREQQSDAALATQE